MFNSATAELFDYLKEKRISVVEIENFIKNGADLDAKDHLGRTALHVVASFGCLEAVRFLIKKGADVDAKENTNSTPLHLAALKGQHDVAETLIRSGAEVDSLSNNNRTPLHLATFKGHTAVINLLLNSRAKINEQNFIGSTALHIAARGGHVEAVKSLLEAGADFTILDGDKTALCAKKTALFAILFNNALSVSVEKIRDITALFIFYGYDSDSARKELNNLNNPSNPIPEEKVHAFNEGIAVGLAQIEKKKEEQQQKELLQPYLAVTLRPTTHTAESTQAAIASAKVTEPTL